MFHKYAVVTLNMCKMHTIIIIYEVKSVDTDEKMCYNKINTVCAVYFT